MCLVSDNKQGFITIRSITFKLFIDVLIELNELKLEPLESAFGGRSDLAAVRVEGNIKQGLCAEFKVHVPVISSPVVVTNEGNNSEVITIISGEIQSLAYCPNL